jgi:deoxyribonuclease V
MFAAADVCYLDSGQACAAVAVAPDARFSSVAWSRTVSTGVTAGYEAGEFWRRELPPLRAVLAGVTGLALIIVDGYADLDPAGRPGLGARVHAETGVPVVGVAKTFFRGAVHAAEVRRGRSARPLYVTAAGMSVADAASMVTRMAGPYRIPEALRLADRLARGLEQPTRDHASAGEPS